MRSLPRSIRCSGLALEIAMLMDYREAAAWENRLRRLKRRLVNRRRKA